MEKTLSMIKPEAVGRGLSGKIIATIEESGLKVVAQKMLRLSREQAARFYAVHQNKAFFDELIENITAGPVIVQVLAGENAIEEYRRLMGNTNPAAAEEGTLRRLYGVSIEKKRRPRFRRPRNCRTGNRLFLQSAGNFGITSGDFSCAVFFSPFCCSSCSPFFPPGQASRLIPPT